MRTFLSSLHAYVRLVRLYQWTKNGLVFMPLIFSQELLNPVAILQSLRACVAFCLVSGATYIFNDILDIEKDRAHPVKRLRPLAHGEIRPAGAAILAVIFLALAWLSARTLPPAFGMALLVYIGLTLSYSLLLKQIFLLDVMAIAIGFVLRAIGGAMAIEVVFSNWLVVCTFFLALFLALGKRRGEIILLEGNADGHRPVLFHYTTAFIDQVLLIVGGGALLTFTIYTCNEEVIARLGTDKLYMTLPFVVYGLIRYLWLIQQNRAEDPSHALLQDRPLLLAIVWWALSAILIIYS